MVSLFGVLMWSIIHFGIATKRDDDNQENNNQDDDNQDNNNHDDDNQENNNHDDDNQEKITMMIIRRTIIR